MSNLGTRGRLVALLVGCGPAVDSDGTAGTATSGGPPTTASASSTTTAPVGSSSGGRTTGSLGEASVGGSTGGQGIPPDFPPGFNDCRLLGGDECPDGEKCVPWASDGGNFWDAKRCTPLVADPAPVGSPCVVEGWPASGVDSCEDGAMCWSVDPETNMGTCAALCVNAPGDDVCADPAKICTNKASIDVCIDGCNPIADDCPVGEACYALEPWLFPERITVCLRPDTAIAVNNDVFVASCAPGWTGIPTGFDPECVDNELCCAPWCDVSDPLCPDGRTCIPWDSPELENDDVGFCAPQ